MRKNTAVIRAFVASFLLIGITFAPGAIAQIATETPTATPTTRPTSTPTPTPGPLTGVEPFVQFHHTGIPFHHGRDRLAAHPNSGDLYIARLFQRGAVTAIQVNHYSDFELESTLFADLPNVVLNIEHTWSGPLIDFKIGEDSSFYVIVQLDTPFEHSGQYIMKLTPGNTEFHIVHFANRREAIALQPIDHPVPGVPTPGVIYAARNVDPYFTKEILYVSGEGAFNPAEVVALASDANYGYYYHCTFTMGPNKSLYVAVNNRIYRLREDRNLELLCNLELKLQGHEYDVYDIAYDDQENEFYFVSGSGYLFNASADFKQVLRLVDYDHPFLVREISITDDGVFAVKLDWNTDSHLYRLHLPTDRPLPTPTITPTPLPPISPHLPSFLPPGAENPPLLLEEGGQLRLVTRTNQNIVNMSIDPHTGNLYYGHHEQIRRQWPGDLYPSYEYRLAIRGPIQPEKGYLPPNRHPYFGSYLQTYLGNFIFGSSDHAFAMFSNQTFHFQRGNYPAEIDVPSRIMVYTGDNPRFLNVPPRHILSYFSNYQEENHRFFYFDPINPRQYYEIELPQSAQDQLQEIVLEPGWFTYLQSLTFGPNNELYALDRGRIIRFDADGAPSLFAQLDDFISTDTVTYLPEDRSFYYLKRIRYITNHSHAIERLPVDDPRPQPVVYLGNDYIRNLVASPGGDRFYFLNSTTREIWEFSPNFTPGEPIHTPTPTPPPATPVPMDWLMLDGYGGIHVSRPEVERPVLPYFAPFDIVRDLERDPLGQGWYMLDGYGGIHRSSPDLPLPIELPYFWGYDVARRLKVIEVEGRRNFLLLDAFGVVHRSGPDVDRIQVDTPYFFIPIARDLQPAETGDGWLLLDAYGALYDSRTRGIEVAAGAYWPQAWQARSLTVFDDGARLLIDSFGGRHVDPRKPALRRLHPIPPGLYFPGFEIIWDFEVIVNE